MRDFVLFVTACVYLRILLRLIQYTSHFFFLVPSYKCGSRPLPRPPGSSQMFMVLIPCHSRFLLHTARLLTVCCCHDKKKILIPQYGVCHTHSQTLNSILSGKAAKNEPLFKITVYYLYLRIFLMNDKVR